MDLFTVDTTGETEFSHQSSKSDKSKAKYFKTVKNSMATMKIKTEGESLEIDYGGIPPPEVDVVAILRNGVLCDKPLCKRPSPRKDDDKTTELRNFCNSMGWIWDDVFAAKLVKPIKKEPSCLDFRNEHSGRKTDVAREMKNSVLIGIEQKNSVEKLPEKKLAKIRKAESSKTKGKDWFNMPATEVTDELKNDMEIIQMRAALDPTHFYKKNDLKTLPKYFQVGTVLPSALEPHQGYNVRNAKKQSIVDEMMEDAVFQQYNKRKYKELKAEKFKSGPKRAYKNKSKRQKKS